MSDRQERLDRLGPGEVAATRSVVFECRWPGKAGFLVGNFRIASTASEREMRETAVQMIRDFAREHLPDGIAPPDLIDIKPGALRWIPDDTEWRRSP